MIKKGKSHEDVINQFLAKGKKIIPVVGKKPCKGWRKKTYNANRLARYKGNISWGLGAGDLVVDVDPRNGGDKSFKALEKDIDTKLTPTVRTASGGWHVYLSFPPGLDLRTIKQEYPGIDFLHEGRHCVTVGSNIDGNAYEWFAPCTEFNQSPAPAALLDILARQVPDEKSPPIVDFAGFGYEKVSTHLAKIANANIPYDQWIRVGMALHAWDTIAGLSLWKKWSAICPKKKGTDYEAKWSSFKSDKGITPATLEWESSKEWKNGWVYVSTIKKFINTNTKRMLDTTSFNFVNAKYIFQSGKGDGKKPLASKVLMDSGDVEVFDSMICAPTEPGVFEFQKKRVLNNFDAGLLPDAVEITKEGRLIIDMVLEFFSAIANDDSQKTDVLLSWFAWQVQNLGKKVRWVPVIVGGFRLGKTSILGLILEKLLGSYTTNISNEALTSQFKDFMVGNLVVIIDELRIVGRDKYQTSIALRNAISDKFVSFEVKHTPRQTLPNYTNYIAFSNYIDAVPVKTEEEAARWWILKTNLKIRSREYYTEIIDGINAYGGEIVKFFRDEYKISNSFYAHEKPDKCDVRETIAENQRWTTGFQEARDLILHEPSEYWSAEYISPKEFFPAVAQAMNLESGSMEERVCPLNPVEKGRLRDELQMRKRIRVNYLGTSRTYFVKNDEWDAERLLEALTSAEAKTQNLAI